MYVCLLIANPDSPITVKPFYWSNSLITVISVPCVCLYIIVAISIRRITHLNVWSDKAMLSTLMLCLYSAQCSNEDFWCKSGPGCVATSMVCDGQLQCMDGSDEYMCRKSPQATQYELWWYFPCYHFRD